MQHSDEPERFTPVADPRPADTAWPTMLWPVPPDTELVGETIGLTALNPAADAAELLRALDHDAVWAHVPGRPRDLAGFQETLEQRCALTDWQCWVIRTRGSVGGLPAGSVVGTTSYLEAHPRDAWLEVGFTLYTPAVWATSVNPEAKLLLFGYAFDTLHAGRVQLKTDTRNHRSQQAITRLGATYEGTLRRSFRRDDGTVRDSVLFSVTAEDWPNVRLRLEQRVRRAGLV
ncbi:GNAT family N-acetyltransferase [Mycolicibacter arupensis]|uniref:GNAT family N-acetyltransferase n=1 Tax=Mycolicibacter arupensis TaxID=342002 RepID=UPI001F421577|nr:GNAT family protein [Mycolicibacter arupensis]